MTSDELARGLSEGGAALPSPEEVLRLLDRNVRDYAIFVLDPTGVVASWNNGAERIKGYAAEEIMGRHFSVFYRPMTSRRESRNSYWRSPAPRDGWRTRVGGCARTDRASGRTW